MCMMYVEKCYTIQTIILAAELLLSSLNFVAMFNFDASLQTLY